MKTLMTIISAALIVGASTAAMAQGSDVNPEQMGRGADGNPSSMYANTMAGNRGNSMQARRGQQGMGGYGYGARSNGMNSSNVSGQFNTPNWNNGRGDRRGM